MTETARNGILLAARILMASAILPTGIARALNVSGFALTLAGAGIPAPNIVATVAVIVQVFGPLAVIVGVMPRLTGCALAGFVGLFAVLLHPFWFYAGASAVTERAFLLADLGLAGAFLMYAMAGPGDWSWRGWRAGGFARRASGKPAKAANGNRPTKRGGRVSAREAA